MDQSDTLDRILHEGDDDDESEEIPTAEVLRRLEQMWMNEKFSPDLLPTNTDITDFVLEQLECMQESLENSNTKSLKISLLRMEVDRIRFMLSSYLRARLKKIEKYTQYILDRNSRTDTTLLAPNELKFAEEYSKNLLSHLENLGLKHMPANLQRLKTNEKVIEPDLQKYVFLKATKDVEEIMVEQETTETAEETVDMQTDDQYIMRYQPVAHLVAEGSLALI